MPYNYFKRKKVHTAKWDKCVSDVEAKQTSVNPYAVCTKSLGKKSFLKNDDKRFKDYNKEFDTYARARNYRDSKYEETGKFQMIKEKDNKFYVEY